MREDQFVREVTQKCEAYKHAHFWLPEPDIRPRAWIRNFDKEDQAVAAVLLDNYCFYNDRLTRQLLSASWQSIADCRPKGPAAPDTAELLRALQSAVCTRVVGERPRPTDSGNLFCRWGRQVLRVPDERFVEPSDAVSRAVMGSPIIFWDDFIGSGDQFIKTWERAHTTNTGVSATSFQKAYDDEPFTALYVCLVSTKTGSQRIWDKYPHVAIVSAHTLADSSVYDITSHPLLGERKSLQGDIIQFLEKYAPRLIPDEPYMQSLERRVYGYNKRGLLLAFEHSTPDSTLPVFWAPGKSPAWTPLRKRT